MLTNLFQTLSEETAPARWDDLFVRLFLALGFGFGAMAIYRIARHGEPRNRSFEITLVLLAVLIAMVTRVIGNNTARAFSLVGALSIVRFRTVVRDTQDTAYVILSVVLGMAVGANLGGIAVAGLIVVLAAILVLRGKRRQQLQPMQADCVLNVRVPLGNLVDELSGTLFPRHLEKHELIALETAKQGTALEASYSVRFRPDASPAEFVRELNKVEGVQNIELRSADAISEK